MSKQISDIVLFWSQFSKESVACVKFITSYKLPVKIVKLDTAQSREAAMNGKLVSISSVPSLLVSYINGEVNVFIGRPKIIAWLQAMIARAQSSIALDQIPSPRNQSTRDVIPRREVRQQVRQKDEEEYDYTQETEIVDEYPIQKAPLKNPDKIPKPKKTQRKKGGPQKVQDDNTEFIGDDEGEYGGTELIFEKEPLPPPQIQSKGFATGAAAAKKADNSLMLSAKKMMAEREGAMGPGEKQY